MCRVRELRRFVGRKVRGVYVEVFVFCVKVESFCVVINSGR